MQLHIWASLAILAFLGLTNGQMDSLPACGQACVNNVIAQGLGCDSGNNACLCQNQDFEFGLHDCAVQACGDEVASQLADYATALCATALEDPPSPAVTTAETPAAEAPTTAPPPPPPPPPPSTTSSPSPVPTTVVEPLSTSSTSIQATSLAVPNTSRPTPTSTTLSTVVTTSRPVSTVTTSAASTTSSSTAAASSAADTQSAESGGLTMTVKIGIGVAAGVTAIAAALVAFLLWRRPKSPARTIQISGPLPGSGRDYSGGMGRLPEKNLSELELRSKRYEDMVPRQVPRHMI